MNTNNKRTIATTEMRMLRGILGVWRLEHTRNEDIRRLLNLLQAMRACSVDACDGLATWKDERRRCCPQRYELGATRCQTTGTYKEDVETADQREHEGGRGHCGYGSGPQGVEEVDKADPCSTNIGSSQ